MTTKVLSGTYANGYSAGASVGAVKVTASGVVNGQGLVANYAGLTLTNSGSISSAAGRSSNNYYGYAGYDGVRLKDVSRVINDNLISGGAGGAGGDGGGDSTSESYRGGVGGVGVYLASGGTLTNKGLTEGGAGGKGGAGGEGGSSLGGTGGAGVSLYGTGSVANTGTIQGGAGGAGGDSAGRHGASASGGTGGVGVSLDAAATVTNWGSIYGGAGGPAGGTPFGGSADGKTGATGDGIVLTAGGVITNGSGSHTHALISGSIGVDVTGSAATTVTNFGTIQGTAASVQFSSSADRLVAMSGAQFIGAINGGGGTLELDGGTGAVSGVGGGGVLSGDDQGSFSGFATYEFDAGGNWTAAGVNLAGGDLARSAGKLTIDGAVTVASASQLDETKAGVITVGAGAAVDNAGQIKATGSGGIVIRDGVDNTGKLIANGGDLTITGAVTGAGSANIFDGILRIDGAFTENADFVGADPSGTLALKRATTYDGTVSGFSTDGETELDLLDVGFTSADEATFSGTSSGGVLTVSDGTHTAKIDLKGDYVGDTFTAKSDGQGGVIVTASDPGASAGAAQLVQAIASFGAGADPPSAFQARFELAQTDPPIAPSVLRTLSNSAARG